MTPAPADFYVARSIACADRFICINRNKTAAWPHKSMISNFLAGFPVPENNFCKPKKFVIKELRKSYVIIYGKNKSKPALYSEIRKK